MYLPWDSGIIAEYVDSPAEQLLRLVPQFFPVLCGCDVALDEAYPVGNSQ